MLSLSTSKKTEKRTCKRCGKVFFAYKKRVEKGRGIYCSKECMKVPRTKEICEKCGKTFYNKQNREHIKVCIKCNKKPKKVKRKCLTCGKEFLAFPYDIKNGHGKYCSRKCVHISFKGKKATKIQMKGLKIGQKISGEKHGNWKGGISKLPYSINFNKKMKKLILKESNSICHMCGMTNKKHLEMYGKSLHTHHIDYNKLNTTVNNLISLCSKCHPKTNDNREMWTRYFKEYKNMIKNNKQKTICYSYGVWDIIHKGHIKLLDKAKSMYDIVIIGVVDDDSVKKKKGKNRPINNQLSRVYMLEAFKSPDCVMLQKTFDPTENLLNLKKSGIKVDVLLKGDDWKYIPGQETIEKLGGKLVKLPYTKTVSTTDIIKKIRGEE